MKKELSVKQIFDDFTSKVILNDSEIKILMLYIKDETIIKIANETAQSPSSVSRTIAELKEKYQKYKELEIIKLKILSDNIEKKI